MFHRPGEGDGSFDRLGGDGRLGGRGSYATVAAEAAQDVVGRHVGEKTGDR